MDDGNGNSLIAYRVSAFCSQLSAAGQRREWMDQTSNAYAYRCLPLLIANQMGWDVLCPEKFSATWDGGSDKNAVTFESDAKLPFVDSHFGSGIITFHTGYLFRTSPGHNLWARGTPNLLKDGIGALEGIIETDWSPYPFTMNWQFTRPNHTITFEKGEPFCRIVPLPRHYVENFDPIITDIGTNKTLDKEYRSWIASRANFLKDLKKKDSEATRQRWQKSYMQGVTQQGNVFDEHQTKLTIKPFKNC